MLETIAYISCTLSLFVLSIFMCVLILHMVKELKNGGKN